MSAVAIVDYGMGNVRSVHNAVVYCGFDAVVTADPKVIADASHIILPGVGAFGDAIANLSRLGLIEVLEKTVLVGGRPFLGVCLGMQVLARSSTEHSVDNKLHRGLCWFDADVIRIEPSDDSLKVPHMGWNRLVHRKSHPVLAKLGGDDLHFYFVHSYHMRCDHEPNVISEVVYGMPISAIVARDNIIATQFHPEKSQDNGIELLTSFLRWKP